MTNRDNLCKFEIDIDSYPKEMCRVSSTIVGPSHQSAIMKAAIEPLLDNHLTSRAHQLSGQPMLADLCQEALDFCRERLQPSTEVNDNAAAAAAAPLLVSLVLIDHMRSPKQYVRTLERWVVSGAFWCGRLLIPGAGATQGQGIFLVLVSDDPGAMPDFVKKLRTETVDVDSSGRPCKERMARLLCTNMLLSDYACDMPFWQTQASTESRFKVIEFTNRHEVFESLKLKKLLKDFVT